MCLGQLFVGLAKSVQGADLLNGFLGGRGVVPEARLALPGVQRIPAFQFARDVKETPGAGPAVRPAIANECEGPKACRNLDDCGMAIVRENDAVVAVAVGTISDGCSLPGRFNDSPKGGLLPSTPD
jgi:hypothetical protein